MPFFFKKKNNHNKNLWISNLYFYVLLKQFTIISSHRLCCIHLCPASDRGRDKNGKLRPKSEGFELYNNSMQNGSPESPQVGWDSYPEPKKMSGEDRLLKNRADHRSSPNVASKLPPNIHKIIFNYTLMHFSSKFDCQIFKLLYD